MAGSTEEAAPGRPPSGEGDASASAAPDGGDETAASPGPDGKDDAGPRAAVRVFGRLPAWAVPVAGVALASLALVFAGIALIVASTSGRRATGDPPAGGDRAAGAGQSGQSGKTDTDRLRADFEELARLVADSSGEVVTKQSTRIAELEAALRVSEAARKEAEEILYGRKELELPPDLVWAFADVEKVAKLRSISSSYRQRLDAVRKQFSRDVGRYGGELGREVKRREAEFARERELVKKREREWLGDVHRRRKELFERHLDSAREQVTRTLQDVCKRAEDLERRHRADEALRVYEEIAGLADVVATDYVKRIAAECRKRIADVKRRAEETERRKKEALEAKEKARRAKVAAARRKAEQKAREKEMARQKAAQPKPGKAGKPPEELVAPEDDVF